MPYFPTVKAIAPKAPEWRKAHDHSDDFKEDIVGGVRDGDERVRPLTEEDGGTAEQDGEKDDLKEITFRERGDGVVRHDAKREVGHVLADRSACVLRDVYRLAAHRRPVEAIAWANDVHHDQANDECQS